MLNMLKAVSITGLSLLLIVSTTGNLFAQDEESFVRETGISKGNAIVLSALCPGLGQMTSGRKVVGVSLFLAEAVSLIIYVNSHENYSTKNKNYEGDIEEFNNIGLVGRKNYYDAKEAFDDLKETNNELDDLHTLRNTAAYIALGVWAYNIVDAVLFSPSSGESRRADRGSKRIEVSSTIIDRTPGIMLTKRF